MARSPSNCQSTVDFVGVDGSRPPASIVPRSPHPVIHDRRVPRASVGVASWSETATSGSGIDHCMARSGTGGGCALLGRGASRRRRLNIGAPGQSTCHHEFVRSRRAGILGLLLFAAPSVWARPASARASARLVYILGPGAEPCPGAKALRAAETLELRAASLTRWRYSRTAQSHELHRPHGPRRNGSGLKGEVGSDCAD